MIDIYIFVFMIHQRFEEEYLRATKEAEKIEAVLGGLTKKNQAQVLFFVSDFGNLSRPKFTAFSEI